MVYNRAQQKSPQDKLTKTDYDANMIELRTHVDDALKELAILESDNCTKKSARTAWDWVFQTDGFFRAYDEEHEAAVASVEPAAPFIKTPTRFG